MPGRALQTMQGVLQLIYERVCKEANGTPCWAGWSNQAAVPTALDGHSPRTLPMMFANISFLDN